MELGLVFPQTEIGPDPTTHARYAEQAEALGFGHLLAYDHVLGADADREGGWRGPYDHTDAFHEPFTLFSYLAAQTDALAFVTGVLVLPQRQTALVAKQAAMVDRFADGRFRLGVGVGWNPLEYVALGQPFEERGRRIEEQVALLRQLWTENPTSFAGDYHEVPDMGLKPLPVQRPIPVWMGGGADVVLRRIARLADGWLLPGGSPAELEAKLDALREYAAEADRSFDDIGLHGRVRFEADAGDLVERVAAWADLGLDYLAIDTMGAGREAAAHVEALETVADALVDAGFELSG